MPHRLLCPAYSIQAGPSPALGFASAVPLRRHPLPERKPTTRQALAGPAPGPRRPLRASCGQLRPTSRNAEVPHLPSAHPAPHAPPPTIPDRPTAALQRHPVARARNERAGNRGDSGRAPARGVIGLTPRALPQWLAAPGRGHRLDQCSEQAFSSRAREIREANCKRRQSVRARPGVSGKRGRCSPGTFQNSWTASMPGCWEDFPPSLLSSWRLCAFLRFALALLRAGTLTGIDPRIIGPNQRAIAGPRDRNRESPPSQSVTHLPAHDWESTGQKYVPTRSTSSHSRPLKRALRCGTRRPNDCTRTTNPCQTNRRALVGLTATSSDRTRQERPRPHRSWIPSRVEGEGLLG